MVKALSGVVPKTKKTVTDRMSLDVRYMLTVQWVTVHRTNAKFNF